MNPRALAVFLAIVSVVPSLLAQVSSPPQPYSNQDAYQIYDLLVPHEETYCTKTRVIVQETIQEGMGARDLASCVSPLVAPEFRDAIANFRAANKTRWVLQRQFELDKPYELVTSDAIEAIFKQGEGAKAKTDPPLEGGWRAFYERYPSSGGYVVLSAVGFNRDKTRAVVYSGASCGSLCGAWSFHLFKKVNGKWTETPGITCHTMS